MEQMEVARELGATGSTTILRLNGPLTLSTLFVLQQKLREIGNVDTVIDVTEVPYIDSAGLGSLISAYVTRERQARKMVLAGVNDRVKMMMTVSGVDQLFPSYASVAEAEKTLAASAK